MHKPDAQIQVPLMTREEGERGLDAIEASLDEDTVETPALFDLKTFRDKLRSALDQEGTEVQQEGRRWNIQSVYRTHVANGVSYFKARLSSSTDHAGPAPGFPLMPVSEHTAALQEVEAERDEKTKSCEALYRDAEGWERDCKAREAELDAAEARALSAEAEKEARADLAAFEDHGDYEAPIESLRRILAALSNPEGREGPEDDYKRSALAEEVIERLKAREAEAKERLESATASAESRGWEKTKPAEPAQLVAYTEKRIYRDAILAVSDTDAERYFFGRPTPQQGPPVSGGGGVGEAGDDEDARIPEQELALRRNDPEFRARLERSIEENRELLERLATPLPEPSGEEDKCGAPGPDGLRCKRSAGHGGQHAAMPNLDAGRLDLEIWGPPEPSGDSGGGQ